MMGFFELFLQNARRPEAWTDPQWANRQFPAVVAASPLRLWRPGDPVPAAGERLLLGVATWSGYDMRLLDVIVEGVQRMPGSERTLEVFSTDDCQTHEDFEAYISGLGRIHQVPVVGFWQSGHLRWSGQGHAARQFAASLYGSSSAEIVEFVTTHTKAPAAQSGA